MTGKATVLFPGFPGAVGTLCASISRGFLNSNSYVNCFQRLRQVQIPSPVFPLIVAPGA